MNIQDFISSVSQQLGADKSSVESATGGLFKVIQDQADSSDVEQLTDKIEGLQALAAKAPAAEAQSGGLLGGLATAASAAMGGGGVADIVAKLSGSGLDAGKITQLIPAFFSFAKQHASPDLIKRILSSVPQLKSLVG